MIAAAVAALAVLAWSWSARYELHSCRGLEIDGYAFTQDGCYLLDRWTGRVELRGVDRSHFFRTIGPPDAVAPTPLTVDTTAPERRGGTEFDSLWNSTP